MPRREKTMQTETDARVASWSAARPQVTNDFQHDADGHSKFWLKGYELLAALPEKRKRNPGQARAAETILDGRERAKFLLRHAAAVYAALTKKQTHFVRAEILAYEAAKLVPRLMPTREQVAAESQKIQRQRTASRSTGDFFSHLLTRPNSGTHFCHAMLLPSRNRSRGSPTSWPTARSIRHRGDDAAGQGRNRHHAQSTLSQRRG